MVATVTAGLRPTAVVVNPLTGLVYVANWNGSLTVIDGATNLVANTVSVSSYPFNALAVDTMRNEIYIATGVGPTGGAGTVAILDGAKYTTGITWLANFYNETPDALAFDPTTGNISAASSYDTVEMYVNHVPSPPSK